MVAGAFSVLTLSYSLQFSYGVFMPHMLAELGWDRSSLAAPFSAYVLMYTWLSFFAGRLTDRLGPRVVIAIGAVGSGVGYMLLSTIEAPWQPYAYLAVASIGASVAFVPCNATVIRWFARRRGLALGIASSGISFAAVVGPLFAGLLIAATDWRTALLLMGAIAGAGLLLASRAMLRDPESHQLTPDGESAETISPSVPGSGVDLGGGERGWTLGEVRRSHSFWLLLAALSLSWIAIFVPFVHLTGYALERGVGAINSALLIVVLGVGGLAGRVLGGGLTDRLGRTPGIVAAIFLQGLAFLGFASSGSFLWLGLWAFVFGIGYSGLSVLFPALLGDLFGRAHIGAIVGFVFAVGGCSAAVGPYLVGAVYDATGGYQMAFVASAIFNGLALGLFAFVRPPVRPVSGANEQHAG